MQNFDYREQGLHPESHLKFGLENKSTLVKCNPAGFAVENYLYIDIISRRQGKIFHIFFNFPKGTSQRD